MDRRLAQNQNPDKRCMPVIRQNHTPEEKAHGYQGPSAHPVDGDPQGRPGRIGKLAPFYVVAGSTVCADESDAYDPLHAKYDMRRVNHSREYRADEGTTNNQAESYFSRLRRMQMGQHHKFGAIHLASYANEAAYREDTRRQPNGSIFLDIIGKCARSPTSRERCGYWQGDRRHEELLAALP